MKTLNRWHLLGAVLFLAISTWSVSASALTALEAGQKGMDYIVKGATDWHNKNRCYGCHTNGMSAWGAAIGLAKGYSVDSTTLAALMDAVKSEQQADGKWTHKRGHYPMAATSFATSGLAFYDRFVSSEAQSNFMKGVDWLLPTQQANGQFPTDSEIVSADNAAGANAIWRGNSLYMTTMGIISLSHAYAITADPKYLTAEEKAVTWLKGYSVPNTQGIAFKLIGLMEGGGAKTDPVVSATRAELLGYQNADGGFGAYIGWGSNAYHTGVAIYALRLSGMFSTDPEISSGINWLLAHQNADGSWPIGTAHLQSGDPVGPSMWPVIALGEFGEFGVVLKPSRLDTLIDAYSPDPQTITYPILITNTGAKRDTYKLNVSGALPGFGAALTTSAVTLDPDASQIVTLTVSAPPNLPYGLPVVHTIIAASQTDSDVTASASVKTYTPPPPPTTGHTTTVTFVDGANATVKTSESVRFAVRVVDADANRIVSGGGFGSVSFYVNGIVVGTDDDADGNGIFEINWNPGWKWSKSGNQSVIAVYSGIDRATGDDLLSSYSLSDINIIVVPPTPAELLPDAVNDLANAQNFFIPPNAPKGVGTKVQAAVKKLNDALAAWQAGDSITALDKIDAAVNQIQGTIDQVDAQRCSAKGGKKCIDDSAADALVGIFKSALTTIQQARSLI